MITLFLWGLFVFIWEMLLYLLMSYTSHYYISLHRVYLHCLFQVCVCVFFPCVQEYVGAMGTQELRDYLTNLLRALRRVHSFKVIHRDVKPANFLYNRRHRRYCILFFFISFFLSFTYDMQLCMNVCYYCILCMIM